MQAYVSIYACRYVCACMYTYVCLCVYVLCMHLQTTCNNIGHNYVVAGCLGVFNIYTRFRLKLYFLSDIQELCDSQMICELEKSLLQATTKPKLTKRKTTNDENSFKSNNSSKQGDQENKNWLSLTPKRQIKHNLCCGVKSATYSSCLTPFAIRSSICGLSISLYVCMYICLCIHHTCKYRSRYIVCMYTHVRMCVGPMYVHTQAYTGLIPGHAYVEPRRMVCEKLAQRQQRKRKETVQKSHSNKVSPCFRPFGAPQPKDGSSSWGFPGDCTALKQAAMSRSINNCRKH